MSETAAEKARKALAKAEAAEKRSKGWRSMRTAPKDGSRVHLWLEISASPMSMGMGDEFAVPDAWFENGKWVHEFRGKPTELNERYISNWQPASASLDGIDIWRG